MKNLLIAFTFVPVLCLGAGRTETGEINGAKFRIDMPEKWNGGLVVYCHGYSPKPGSYDDPKSNPFIDIFVNQGYAFVQSGDRKSTRLNSSHGYISYAVFCLKKKKKKCK